MAQAARARGATDCLFMNSDGRLTEASTSNVWIIKGDTVLTPALNAGLLAGVTRRLLFGMCEAQGIPCLEQDLYDADVRQADGIFLTSTLRDISPVDSLDGESRPRCELLDKLVVGFSQYCDHLTKTVYEPALRDVQ